MDRSIGWFRTPMACQPRRCLDTARARQRFGFTANTPLETDLANTIAWYESTHP